MVVPPEVKLRTVEGALGPKLSVSCSDVTTTVPLATVLSALRSITNGVVDAAVERERVAGRQISCRAGCGACCRQLVPLSHTEAREMPGLVANLEPDHRERVVGRFDAAMERLRASGTLSRLEKCSTLSPEDLRAFVVEYFELGIACPFLEAESCSIHSTRPLICREYLVTSDPVHCANLSKEKIAPVTIAADILSALMRVERANNGVRGWVPLILALSTQDVKTDTERTVPEWVSLVLGEIEKARAAQGSPSGA
jgi:Fe-S-cluster containining protein